MADQSGADDNLTPRMRRFVEEYIVDLNAKQAAIRAGYSAHSATQTGCDLLAEPKITAAIETAVAERSARTKITADEVLLELTKLGRANMQDYMSATDGGDPYLDFSKLTRDQASCLQEVTVEDYTEGRGENARDVKRVKFRLCDKRAALVDLGKHLGMFIDRKAVTFPEGVPVVQLSKDDFRELAGDLVGKV